MFGFGLSFYFPQYYWVKEYPLISILMWLFRVELSLPCWCDGSVSLRIAGLTFTVGWTTLGHIRRARENKLSIEELQEKMAAAVAKAMEKAKENTAKTDENTQKDDENVENVTKNDEKASKPAYQGVEIDSDGIRAVHVRDDAARGMLHSNMGWYMERFVMGAKLVVSTDEYVIHNDRSFTLPDYEHANTLEIGDVVVFGNEEKHLAARITGYQQSPEGERTYFYQVA